jgi:tripartite-type tricarboxylate transporter receptor subunit TctC
VTVEQARAAPIALRCGPKIIVAAAIAAALAGTGFRTKDARAQGAPSQGAAYPSKAMRLIVPFPAGGGADFIARLFAPKLNESLGQPVIVENRPGASTIIGGDLVAKAASDGHTLFMATFTNAVNPALHPKMPWDITRDLAPVSLLSTASYTLAVHPSLPVKSPRELVAFSKARPSRLNFASAGNGAPGHLAGELLNTVANIKIVHVPYKGLAPALTDVLGGQVPITFGNNIATVPHLKSGRLRALGVTSAARSRLMPEVPTMIEGGLPDFIVVGWYAIYATAGSPQASIAKLHAELARLVRDPDVQRRLASDGSDPVGSTPAELASFVRAEIDKWTKVVKSAGLQAD